MSGPCYHFSSLRKDEQLVEWQLSFLPQTHLHAAFLLLKRNQDLTVSLLQLPGNVGVNLPLKRWTCTLCASLVGVSFLFLITLFHPVLTQVAINEVQCLLSLHWETCLSGGLECSHGGHRCSRGSAASTLARHVCTVFFLRSRYNVVKTRSHLTMP